MCGDSSPAIEVFHDEKPQSPNIVIEDLAPYEHPVYIRVTQKGEGDFIDRLMTVLRSHKAAQALPNTVRGLKERFRSIPEDEIDLISTLLVNCTVVKRDNLEIVTDETGARVLQFIAIQTVSPKSKFKPQ